MNRFAPPAARVRDARHSIVYRNDREFCGWPFICGLLDDRARAICSSPSRGSACAYTDPGDVHHDEVAKVGPKIVSHDRRDNGATWDRRKS